MVIYDIIVPISVSDRDLKSSRITFNLDFRHEVLLYGVCHLVSYRLSAFAPLTVLHGRVFFIT